MAGKRFWAIWVKQTLLVFVLLFVFGVVTQSFLDPGGDDLLAAGFTVVAVYVGAAASIGLVHLISQSLYLWLFSGEDMVDAIVDDFRRAKLPGPGFGQPKNYDYLGMLADDDEAAPLDRVRAAVLVGGYNAVMAKGLFRSLAMRKALDKAVLRYVEEAPTR